MTLHDDSNVCPWSRARCARAQAAAAVSAFLRDAFPPDGAPPTQAASAAAMLFEDAARATEELEHALALHRGSGA
jgi:hypothetical protein